MLKNRLTFLVLIFGLLSLTSCATAGNDSLRNVSQQKVSKELVDGTTTMKQVQAMFGAPMSTSFTNGGDAIWTYQLTHMSADAASYIPVVGLFAGSSSGTKKNLTILFDKNNVVKKYAMTESKVKVRTGLFNQ